VSATAPVFTGLYLFVRDLGASLAFHRRVGLQVEEVGEDFARAELPNGQSIEFGTAKLTRSYDPNWRDPSGASTNALNVSLPSRDAVDAMYRDLIAAGYSGHLTPIDAFWGARYAIIEDPDGNQVGFHGR
jgi:uncharacterized glyoxalase superfamily protein PhnB